MTIYPAIDLKEGRCVRLLQGRAEDTTVYGDDPVAMAERWQSEGAKWLHVVDLDGAFSGRAGNLEAIAAIARSVDIPVQTSGGIRSLEDIALRLETLGASRVVLGTVAIEDPQLVALACERWPGRIAIGIDAKDGFVAVRGWVEKTDRRPIELALEMRDMGVDTVIYTDISRDGMQSGANLAATRELLEKSGLSVIASGGIGSLGDVLDVKATGAAGVIIGKALYSGALRLEEALNA